MAIQLCFLMSEESRTGYAELSNKEVFILHVNDQNIEVILAHHGIESTDLYPIQFFYNLVPMAPACLPNMSRKSLITIFKEALNVYKCSGIRIWKRMRNHLLSLIFSLY